MAQQPPVDPDMYTRPLMFTPTMHRDVYRAVDPKNPEISAKGKSVLITGGSRGIGRGVAIQWAIAGASAIVVTGRDLSSLEEASKAIKEAATDPGMKLLAEPCDATDEVAVGKLFAKVKEEIGKLDVLIANVGGMLQAPKNLKLVEKKPQDWWADIAMNVKGTYLAIYNYITVFTSGDENATGTVIVMSSGAAILPFAGQSSYGTSKVFMHRLLDYVLLEHPKMRAISLAPGIIETTDIPKQFIPFARDTVELVGGFCLWLSTPKADFLNGTWLYVNWDVDELVQHKEEIVRKGLLKTKFLDAELKEGGYSFED